MSPLRNTDKALPLRECASDAEPRRASHSRVARNARFGATQKCRSEGFRTRSRGPKELRGERGRGCSRGPPTATASRTCAHGERPSHREPAQPGILRLPTAGGGEDDPASRRRGRRQPLRHAGRRPNEPGQRDLARRTPRPRAGGMPVAAEASAAATARSQAGSSTRIPPEEAPNSSARPSGSPPARVQHCRHQLEPASVETGGLAPCRALGRPDQRLHLHGERSAPAPGGAPTPRRARRRPREQVGGRSCEASASISNQADSPSAPNRFLPPARTRSPDRASPSKVSTTSTACSRARGPARSPSLVTWPVSSDRDALLLANPTRASVQVRTCASAAGHLGAGESRRVWMESTAEEGAARRPCRGPRRGRDQARMRCASPATPSRVRALRPVRGTPRLTRAGSDARGASRASTCSSSVDLPIPGSPASRPTEAGTRPAPRTRSRPGNPVFICASTAGRPSSRRGDPHRSRAVAPDASSIVPQPPQPGHRPTHWAICWPHAVQEKNVRGRHARRRYPPGTTHFGGGVGADG